MEFGLGVIYVLVVGAVLVSMVVLHLKGPDKQYKWFYLGCQGSVVVWCMSQIFVLLSDSTVQLAVSYYIGNIGICMIGALWYYFACSYTGKPLAGFHRYAPAAVAVFHYACVLTNPWHHLYYKSFDLDQVEHGCFFYTNVAATYFFVVVGAVVLYFNMEKDDKVDSPMQGQLLIVASVLIPVFLNAVYLSGLVSSAFDITPLGFGISIILVMFATLKYHFMDLSKELAITNEKLLLERERNRIAQEVHDTAGHTLTMIQSYMKLIQVANENGEQEAVGTYISEARTLTNQGIRELRMAINEMRQEAGYELVTQGIMQLAGQVKEIPVEVTIKGEDGEQYSHLSRMLYDCTRETITNALKYAKASRIEIVLRFKKDSVELVIGDDGVGCEELKDNNGLYGIRKRVKESGGTVRFITGKGEGFLTRIHVDL